MKKIKYFIVMLLSFTFASCNDFLEVDTTKAGMSKEMAMGNPANVKLMLAQLFDRDNGMGKDKTYRNRVDYYYLANTDVERNKSVVNNQSIDASNGAGLASYFITSSTTDPGLNETWDMIYVNIETCNNIIQAITEMGVATNENEWGVLLAQALAMRAFYYYDLVSFWGDVPARWEPITEENMYVPATDREEIYDHILQDLADAQTYMSNANAQYVTSIASLPSLQAIQGFRARVALSAAGYAQRPQAQAAKYVKKPGAAENAFAFVGRVNEGKRMEYIQMAKDECSKVIAVKGNSLIPFEDVFKAVSRGETDPTKTESLWEMRYRNQIIKGWGLRHAKDTHTDRATGDRGWVVGSFYWDFDKFDTRRDVTIVPYYWTGAAGGESLTVSKMNELYFGKLRPEWNTNAAENSKVDANGDSYIGKIVIRYADVLLMYAEACIELGQDVGDGTEKFNWVRRRAFNNNTAYDKASITMDDIMMERKLEFAGEALRKRDLIRWGVLKQKMDEEAANCVALRNNTDPGSKYSDVPKEVKYRIDTINIATREFKMVFWGMNKGEIGDAPTPPSTPGTAKSWSTAGSMWTAMNSTTDKYEERFYTLSIDPDLRSLLPYQTTTINNSNGRLKRNLYGY